MVARCSDRANRCVSGGAAEFLRVTVGIWLVRLPQTIELSTNLHWRINYIQYYVILKF